MALFEKGASLERDFARFAITVPETAPYILYMHAANAGQLAHIYSSGIWLPWNTKK